MMRKAHLEFYEFVTIIKREQNLTESIIKNVNNGIDPPPLVYVAQTIHHEAISIPMMPMSIIIITQWHRHVCSASFLIESAIDDWNCLIMTKMSFTDFKVDVFYVMICLKWFVIVQFKIGLMGFDLMGSQTNFEPEITIKMTWSNSIGHAEYKNKKISCLYKVLP